MSPPRRILAIGAVFLLLTLCNASLHTPDSSATHLMFNNGRAIRFDEHALEDDHFRVMSAEDSEKKGLYFIQFHERLTPEVISEIKGLLGSPLGDHYGHFVFSVYTKMSALKEARNLASVKWVGEFRPEYKLSKELSKDKDVSVASGMTFLRAKGEDELMHTLQMEKNAKVDFHAKMRTWGNSAPEVEEIAATLAQDFTHDEVVTFMETWMSALGINMFEFDHSPRKIAFMIPIGSAVYVADYLALQPEVKLVERMRPLTIGNSDSVGYMQSGTSGTTTMWTAGLTGTSQYIAVADTGVDTKHCAFDGSSGASSSTFVTSASSGATASTKTFRYRNQIWSGSSAYYDSDSTDTDGHGSHVAGSAVGGTSFSAPGHAKSALLSVYDMMGTSGVLVSPSDLGNFYSDFNTHSSVSSTLFINTNSWSASCSSCPCADWGYTSNAQETDSFLYSNQDFVVLFAAGNAGDSGSCTGSIASPSTAKNIITVGSTVGTSSLSYFSSIGPTEDGRVKPEILAPGSNIVSVKTGSGNTNGICTSTTKSGTSMATPLTAGAIAIIRQYYKDGYYPGGASNGGNTVTPNADLMKATLFASAEPFDSTNTGLSNSYGYGHTRLNNILYLSSGNNGFKMQATTSSVTITTNQVDKYCYSVTSTTKPFVAALSYTDFYGTVGTSSSALVNDINLVVSAPDGRNYRGNQATAAYDSYNPNERVYITTPTTGIHCIFVYGRSINAAGNQSGTTKYALVTRYADGTAQGSTETAYIAVSGTCMSGGAGSGAPQISQDTVKSSGMTIILTLPSGTWAASGSTFDGQRQNILDSLTPYDSSKSTGWAGVKSNFAVSNVVRTSDTVVTITLSSSAFSSYSISDSNEYLKISIPASATSHSSALPGHPNVEICYLSDCGAPAASSSSVGVTSVPTILSAVVAVILSIFLI